MTPLEAQEIINKYWSSMKDLQPNAIVQPITDLPCSPGKIRYAHLVFGEELIKKGLLPIETANKLGTSYSRIHTIFVEDPEPINQKYRKYMKGLSEGKIIKGFSLSKIVAPLEMEIEYHNFLADCQGNYKKPDK